MAGRPDAPYHHPLRLRRVLFYEVEISEYIFPRANAQMLTVQYVCVPVPLKVGTSLNL